MTTFMERVHKRLFPIQSRNTGLLETMLVRQQETSADLFRKLVVLSDHQKDLDKYSDSARKDDIAYSYNMYYNNSTVDGIMGRYLDYGLGKRVTIESDTHDKVVTEALVAIRNKPVFGVKNFRQLGLSFINESELMFVLWYDETTKLTTITRLQTSDVEIVWADEVTMNTPLVYIYKSEDGDVVYRDWMAQDDSVQQYLSDNDGLTYADDLDSNILGMKHVVVWSVGNKRHVTTGRGMPLLSAIFKNAEYLTQFDDQRFAISSESAKYTEEYTVSGGTKDLEDFINREQLGVPEYGSNFVGNEQVSREWNNNPTGANAERFNQHVWLQGIAASTTLNGAMLGVPSMLSNRSVLDKLMEVFIEYIESFQNTIADTIRDVFVVVVLISTNAQVIGTPEIGEQVNELMLDVSLDTPINLDVESAIEYIKLQRSREKITPEEEEQLIKLEARVYQKLGVL